jgi:uncharacterized protein
MTAGNRSGERTALITGATGGIGLELARCFARDGYQIILVARRTAELNTLAERFAREHKIKVETISADLSDPRSADELVAEIERRGLTVDVLVNNAGYGQYGSFIETDADTELRMINLNMVTLTRLSKLLLPGMVARRWGKVLNVASTAAFMPGPLMAVYYASKAYVLSLSEALNEELRGTGVSVTALCPGATQTDFQARAKMEDSKLFSGRKIMDATTVAQIGYEGLMQGRPLVIPGGVNRLQTFATRLLPRRMVPGMVRRAQARTGA